jgi:glycosyltransferase involved in cell wall biosynthesis
MRIALVSEHASPLAVLGGVDAGGQNVHVAGLATALAARGAEVVVHTRRDDPDLPARVPLAGGVVVEHVDAGPARPVPKDDLLPLMEQFAVELRRSWSANRPDVVHGHFWMSGLAALDAAGPLGIPVAQTFHALGTVKRRHQAEQDTSPAERLDDEATVAKSADRIVATAREEVGELVDMGADPARISVVPCGVDLERFTPDGPAAPRTPGLRRLVVVSRLVRRKGIGTVVAALARLPRTELLVAGGPERAALDRDPEAVRLTRLAGRLGVSDRVHLLGRAGQDRIPVLLRSADVVVCPPWYEPFGMTAVEAMACGVPVVASAVGGLLDTVVDGRTGLHVPARRPGLLAEALAGLLDTPDLRASYGRAGAERAAARYGWDSVAAATLDVYRSMVREGRAASAEAGA